jgi:type IV pilus assembly protein PilA
MPRPPLRPAGRPGFLFIELLIVLGILGILGTITIVAINPRKQLCEAENARRRVTARELQNAVNQYAIRTRHPAGDVPSGGAGSPICRQGLASGSGCVTLDVLVPDYVLSLPVDAAETDPDITGYLIRRGPTGLVLDEVTPAHIEDCGAAR